jgi:hypothetical protein
LNLCGTGGLAGEPAEPWNGLNGSEQINIRNDMADIVVCGDLEGGIEKSGELSKLETLGSIEIFKELDPPREILIRRLRGTRAVLEFRGRAALDEET